MISLCMIVKNEERNLPRCLNSVKDCVDEIVIVDTGSNDNTVKIAEQFGAKIFHYQWNEDFAAARNYSLDKATGDWILYLDADEELEPNCCERLRALARTSLYEAYFFQIINLTDGNDPLKHINVRMFRNKPEYRFEGKLHEQIISSITAKGSQQPVVNSGICIIHYGYLASEFLAKNKAVRNHRINRRLVDDDPNNPFYLYSLGGSCVNLNDLEGAIAHYRKALQHVNLRAMYAPSIFISLISCLLKTGRLAEAVEYMEQCKANYPDYVDIHFVEGEFYHQLGHISRAIPCFEKCLQLGEQLTGKYTSRTGVGSFLPNFKLAEIYRDEGDLKKALQYQIEGLKRKNSDMNQYITLAQILKKSLGSGQLVYETLKANVKHKDKVTERMMLARMLYEIEEYDLAATLFSELPAKKKEVAYYKAMACMRTGRFDEALQNLKQIREPHLYEKVIEELLIAQWTSTPPMDTLPYLEQDTVLDQEYCQILKSINEILLGRPPVAEISVYNYYFGNIINKILAKKGFTVVDTIFTHCGLASAEQKIGYLMEDDSNAHRVEMAGRLALLEMKKGTVQPDCLFALSKYFYNNDQLDSAQSILQRALHMAPDANNYQELLKNIYSRQTLKMVLAALRHYPDNPKFNRWLIELHQTFKKDTRLKGVH
ncbi:TPR domain-containing glycosyltransferase [Desulforamulus putei]|uniref:Glycosyltransferase involved in cell wall bisynthesis n=1 Tax=Desulforamulus putei DSM 12395 TaxID=1121429 RepID=A0A1M4S875_9FIRM|nr:TPR domain-containing glycosyltransferase [Desulforamulus putei]SHE28416.1 Glycosyltransferase involved in cell wall bisynthesis [Desulforamulus putei DSM 12395]